MKQIITNPEAVAIYMENFNQLGEAILLSGGNSFSILKRHDELLRILAINNIEVTAKYDGPEFKKQEDMEERDEEMVLMSFKTNI